MTKYKPPMKRCLAALATTLSIFAIASAEEFSPGLDVVELDRIVVVAPPIIEGNIADRYGSVSSVITEQQIRDLNAQDLATSLRRTPGVTISRYNPIGSFGGAEGGGVFIRGMGSSRPGGEIKTFIDGIPMYMGVWNHPLLDLLSIDTAAAIEVYKSPQPQYFGNALAAVNIVPKRKVEENFRTDLQVAGGSFNTFIQTSEHAGKKGAIDYYLGQSYRTSDGHRDNADGTLRNYFARIGSELGENWYAYVFGLHTDNYALDPGERGAPPVLREGRYGTEATMGGVTIQHAHEHAQGRYQIYINEVKGRQLDRPDGRPDATWTTEHRGARARETWTLWHDVELLFGLDYDETEGKGRGGPAADWPGETRRITSPYTAVSHLLGDPYGWHAIPSAGVRYYNHNRFDSEFAPHAGLVAGHGNTRFHFGYSRGVIYPGLEVQILSDVINPALGDTWRNLEAETLNHFEIGVSHLWDRVRGDLTLFRDEGRNRYMIVLPPPPPPSFQNVGDYRTHGLETTVTYLPTDSLSVFGGLTLLDTRPGNLPYAPTTTVSAGANWRLARRFQISMDSQYVSSMHVDGQARRTGAPNQNKVGSHYLVNGKLSYFPDFAAWNLAGELFIAGENLTDVSYEYRPDYPMPGINAMAGMRITF